MGDSFLKLLLVVVMAAGGVTEMVVIVVGLVDAVVVGFGGVEDMLNGLLLEVIS